MRNSIASALVVLIGFVQIIGYVFQNPMIKGFGVALASSPLPIVFTQVKGIETFASDFAVELQFADHSRTRITITPKTYGLIKAPYNLRNVYGAALAYGPVLPKSVYQSVLQAGFCRESVLKSGLKIKDQITDIHVFITTKTIGRDDSWTLEHVCN